MTRPQLFIYIHHKVLRGLDWHGKHGTESGPRPPDGTRAGRPGPVAIVLKDYAATDIDVTTRGLGRWAGGEIDTVVGQEVTS